MSGSLHSISKINEITPHLYLTSVYGATRENIQRYNATLLVNCAQELPKQDIRGVESIKLFLDDMPHAIINVYFDRIADKIHEHATRGGRTVIHCVCGISRAASISIAYLMKYKGMSLRAAHEYVLARRRVIRPNQGFWRQLIDYEKRLNRQDMKPATPSYNTYACTQPATKEIQIPIQIIRSSEPPQPQTAPAYSATTKSNSVRDLNNYTMSNYTVNMSPSSHANPNVYGTSSSSASANRYTPTNDYSTRYSHPINNEYSSTSNPYGNNNSSAANGNGNALSSRYVTQIVPSQNYRTSSLNNLFNAAPHSIPLPNREEIVQYESAASGAYKFMDGSHRTSLMLDNFNEPKYSSLKPTTFSTVYGNRQQTGYGDRYY